MNPQDDLCQHDGPKFRAAFHEDDGSGTTAVIDVCFACLWALRKASASLLSAVLPKEDDDAGPKAGPSR